MTNLSERQFIGRAKNAVSAYLNRKLVVPKIYLDATWSGEPVDLLAIDRAGVGDVHAVLMVFRESHAGLDRAAESTRTISKAAEAIEKLHKLPAQYKYVVIVSSLSYGLTMKFTSIFKNQTFAEDGIGRISVLYVDLSGDDLTVTDVLKPERFRSSQQILNLTDEYVATHTPNMEYRDPADFEVHA